MKAGKMDIINAACNVVEAQQARKKAYIAGDDTGSCESHLNSCIFKLKWLIERDRPAVRKRLKLSDAG